MTDFLNKSQREALAATLALMPNTTVPDDADALMKTSDGYLTLVAKFINENWTQHKLLIADLRKSFKDADEELVEKLFQLAIALNPRKGACTFDAASVKSGEIIHFLLQPIGDLNCLGFCKLLIALQEAGAVIHISWITLDRKPYATTPTHYNDAVYGIELPESLTLTPLSLASCDSQVKICQRAMETVLSAEHTANLIQVPVPSAPQNRPAVLKGLSHRVNADHVVYVGVNPEQTQQRIDSVDMDASTKHVDVEKLVPFEVQRDFYGMQYNGGKLASVLDFLIGRLNIHQRRANEMKK